MISRRPNFTPLPTTNVPLATRFAVIAVLALAVGSVPRGQIGRPQLAIPELTEARDAASSLERTKIGHVVVPRIFRATLPPNLKTMAVGARKQVFVATVLPLVLRENDRIRAQRRRIIEIYGRRATGLPLLPADRVWLDGIAGVYRTEDLNELLRRVDIVPPSLALAQAAEESGWGTSRFALLGNALFGQWTSTRGAGIVPGGRPEGATHEVKAYGMLAESVRDYMRNLNTHPAYEGLRQIRATQRDVGGAPEGHGLSAALVRYSARGQDYVRSLRAIIRVNALDALDSARLGDQRLASLDWS